MSGLKGVLPILPTIFTSTGTIDESGMRRVLDYIVAAGAHGVGFPGLASEYDTLTRDERLHMTARIGEWLGGRLPYVVGATATSPEDALAFAEASAKAGA